MIYSLQVCFVFGILYLLYYLLLRHLTFHSLNRCFLILIIPLAVVLPLIGTTLPILSDTFIIIPPLEVLQEQTHGVANSFTVTETIGTKKIDVYKILRIMYLIGCGISIIRISTVLWKLYNLRKNATVQHYPSYDLVYTNTKEVFSFYRWIMVPKDFNMASSSLIVSHETAHIKYKHTIDTLLTSIFITVFWYNPLVYCYRRSLKALHEFQADAFVLQQQTKTTYLKTLLAHLTTNRTTHLYHYFNHYIIKKRIDMITKNTSKSFKKLSYLVVIPVCIICIMAFAPAGVMNKKFVSSNTSFLHIKPSPPKLFPVKNGTKGDITATFGRKQQHPKLKHNRVHNGIDIKAVIGTPVIATANGTVVKATYKGNWGNLIIVAHGDGYETWYAHLSGFNTKENLVVKAGDVIGYAGNTGLSTGPHLHYEVKLNGEHVNPMNYIK